eukprot:m.71298 g.71298  ORF g.71298 m.71298 type:complete len:198 (-) comp20155_c0_seq1:182-775(-)
MACVQSKQFFPLVHFWFSSWQDFDTMEKSGEIRKRPAFDKVNHEIREEFRQEAGSMSATDRQLLDEAYDKEKKLSSGIDVANVFWILACVFTVHYFDVGDVLIYDDRVDRTALQLSGLFFVVAAALAIYCIVILAYLFKVPDYEAHSPWAVPASTICGILAAACFWYAVWPVWSWMTFVIVPLLLMGLVMILVVIPF